MNFILVLFFAASCSIVNGDGYGYIYDPPPTQLTYPPKTTTCPPCKTPPPPTPTYLPPTTCPTPPPCKVSTCPPPVQCPTPRPVTCPPRVTCPPTVTCPPRVTCPTIPPPKPCPTQPPCKKCETCVTLGSTYLPPVTPPTCPICVKEENVVVKYVPLDVDTKMNSVKYSCALFKNDDERIVANEDQFSYKYIDDKELARIKSLKNSNLVY